MKHSGYLPIPVVPRYTAQAWGLKVLGTSRCHAQLAVMRLSVGPLSLASARVFCSEQ